MTPTPAPLAEPGRIGRAGRRSAGARPRAGALAVLIGLAAALLAVLTTPGTTPPLYNGLGFPDEPYRWLNPPAGSPSTPKWTPAGGTLGVTDGASDSGSFMSAEQGPQVAFFADPGSFVTPDGATGVKVGASAVSPPGAPPAGAMPASNVYRFSATPVGASGSLSFAEGRKFLLNLRANAATDRVVLLHRWDGSQWQQRATFQVGTEIYAGTVSALGDYALFRMAPGSTITVQHSDPSPLPATSAPATSRGGGSTGQAATGKATTKAGAASSGSPSRSASTSGTASPTASGSATASGSGAATGTAGSTGDDGSLAAGEQPGVVPGLVQPDPGVSGGALWWVIAGVAAALAAGLVGLRVVLARRTATAPPPADPR